MCMDYRPIADASIWYIIINIATPLLQPPMQSNNMPVNRLQSEVFT